MSVLAPEQKPENSGNPYRPSIGSALSATATFGRPMKWYSPIRWQWHRRVSYQGGSRAPFFLPRSSCCHKKDTEGIFPKSGEALNVQTNHSKLSNQGVYECPRDRFKANRCGFDCRIFGPHRPAHWSGNASTESRSGAKLARQCRPDRGVRQARFYVIRNTSMPAVLVETGFVTGAQDAQNFNNPAWRQQMSQAIAAGIMQYVQQEL